MGETNDLLVQAIKSMQTELGMQIDGLSASLAKFEHAWPPIERDIVDARRRVGSLERRLALLEEKVSKSRAPAPADAQRAADELANRRRILA